MRSASYSFGLSKTQTSSATGSCFQVAKNSNYFKYSFCDDDVFDFTEDGSVSECIESVCEMVNDFIKESGLNVEFNHFKRLNSHSFEFISKDDRPEFYNVYAAMIISRFFVSGYYPYQVVIWAMYQMYKRGFSVIESYIIASMYDGYASYSFSNCGILSINKYRELKKPKELFRIGEGLVRRFTEMLKPSEKVQYGYGPFLGVTNYEKIENLKKIPDLYVTYMQALEKFEEISSRFLRFTPQSVEKMAYLPSRELTKKLNLYVIIFNQGFSFPLWNNQLKIYDNKEVVPLNFGNFCQDDFEVVNAETFANDLKEFILDPYKDDHVYSMMNAAIVARGISFNDLKKMIK